MKEPVRTAKTSYRSFKKFLQRHGVIAPTPQPVRNDSDVPESDVPSSEGALPKPPTGPGSVPKEERDKKRFFTPDERAKKREEQGNKCANGCGTDIDASNSAGHHIDRHADGGPTTPENHAEVCTDCHKDLHSKKKD
ncbi:MULTISPECIES: HNH endonuclease [unclassified Pseudoalteromonas]|uniref:HNH endonuclease n=1 Tax=unclassified Pseudoalteromonas TaxID=194690 RepID=UPI001F52426E|nr:MULTISPECIES: HNH endonuclease signature motif containing protein [unclassified Pseudoalteromonas]